MSVEIKVAAVEPIRPTFARTARRFGTAKPANRYQEASFDLQPKDNFHYRPVWDPEHDIYDARRTSIVMADSDAFRDPRQYYYATYVINRAKLQEAAEKNFEFVEKHGLMATLSDAQVSGLNQAVLPFRHLEWAANLHNCFITAYCFGSAMAQGAMYATTDRLGMAQYISRIGLLLDGNTGTSLDEAKERWLTDAAWQPLRQLAERMLVKKDWFELFVAQNVVLDAIVHPVFFQRFVDEVKEPGAAFLAMLTEFMEAWYGDNRKWVDACLKIAAGESEHNRDLINGWVATWRADAIAAVKPLMPVLGVTGAARLDKALSELDSRIKKCGLSAQGAA